MKRKSPRGIPDFSRQSPRPKGAPVPDPATSTKPASAPAPRAKPQAMPSKAGQRGK
jgi:hypothetical protein